VTTLILGALFDTGTLRLKFSDALNIQLFTKCFGQPCKQAIILC
jgi:hypothetical protein